MRSSLPKSSPSPVFPTNSSPMKLNIDASQRIVQLRDMLAEAKRQFESDGDDIHPHIMQLENELEDLQKELQLSAQLAGLGVKLEDSGEDPGGEQQRALEAMIASTMNNASSETEDEEGEGEGEGKYEDEASGYDSSPGNRSNPFNWDEEEVEQNWQNMWENSLRVLSKVENGSPEAKLEEIDKLTASPPRKLFKEKKAKPGKAGTKKRK